MKRIIMMSWAAPALAATAAFSPALAQQPAPGLYALHSAAAGKCPGLDWHVDVAPDMTLSGVAGWDNMKHIARLSGKIGKDGALTMKGVIVGSGKTVEIKGTTVGANINLAVVSGNTPCDGIYLNIPKAVGAVP